MKTISFGKIATVIDDKAKTVQTYKYKDLDAVIMDENEITVKYLYGELKRRRKYLKQLGFILKETIWYDDESPYSKIREIYMKEND